MRRTLSIQEQSLFELFSNFSYKLPKDPELILYDFYFLTSFGKEIEGRNMNANYAIQEASDDIVNMLHIHMKKAVFYAVTAEMRHLFNRFNLNGLENTISKEFYEFVQEYYLETRRIANLSSDTVANSLGIGIDLTKISDRDRKILTAEDEKGRLISYRAIKNVIKRFGWNNSKFAIFAEDIFNIKEWRRSYGGKPWAAIAESLYRLERAGKKNEKIIWIDHAYDLQHNTDTVFNKLKLYYKDGGYNWIKKALDWKRDVLSINSFYKKVSIQLRPLVAYVYKVTTGKSIISAEDEEENKDKIKAQPSDTINTQTSSSFRRLDSKNYDFKEEDIVRIWNLNSYIVADYEVQDWASQNGIKIGTNSFNDLETTEDYKVIAIGEHDKFPGKVIVLIQPKGSDYVYLFDQKGLKKKVLPSTGEPYNSEEYTDVSYISPNWTNVKLETEFLDFALSNPKFIWLSDATITDALLTIYTFKREEKLVLQKGKFSGVWLDGAFEDGTFLSGTWKNGIFDGGTWVAGKWIDGVWLQGTWEGGEILQDDGSYEYSSKHPE